LYRQSPRQFPSRIGEPHYQDRAAVRRVRSNGEVKWNGRRVFLSEALRGEPVGFEQEDDRLWKVLFGPLQIALLDSYAGTVLRTPVKVLPMYPA
jgi:hypothetical protein